jgi:hypothetical protein
MLHNDLADFSKIPKRAIGESYIVHTSIRVIMPTSKTERNTFSKIRRSGN